MSKQKQNRNLHNALNENINITANLTTTQNQNFNLQLLLPSHFKKENVNRIPSSYSLILKNKSLYPIFGFTLIEIVIAMTVVAILSMLAYANYTKHLTRSRRADALTGLFNIQSYLEQQFTLQNSYPSAIPDNLATTLYYKYTLPTITNTYFKIMAIPITGGPQVKDAECPSISLDSKGAQTAGTGENQTLNNTCWNR